MGENDMTNTQLADKLTQLINSKCDKLQQSIDAINKEMKEIKELKVKYDKIHRKVASQDTQIKDLRTDVDACSSYLDRSATLLVNGIPFKEKEFLSHKIGFETLPRMKFYRYRGNNKNSNRPIALKFPSEFDKIEFKNAYLKIAACLHLSCIDGFQDSNARIFINDDLDPATYKLFQSALNLKKRQVIVSVETPHSAVYVRINKTSKLIHIKSQQDLDDIDNASKPK